MIIAKAVARQASRLHDHAFGVLRWSYGLCGSSANSLLIYSEVPSIVRVPALVWVKSLGTT